MDWIVEHNIRAMKFGPLTEELSNNRAYAIEESNLINQELDRKIQETEIECKEYMESCIVNLSTYKRVLKKGSLGKSLLKDSTLYRPFTKDDYYNGIKKDKSKLIVKDLIASKYFKGRTLRIDQSFITMYEDKFSKNLIKYYKGVLESDGYIDGYVIFLGEEEQFSAIDVLLLVKQNNSYIYLHEFLSTSSGMSYHLGEWMDSLNDEDYEEGDRDNHIIFTKDELLALLRKGDRRKVAKLLPS